MFAACAQVGLNALVRVEVLGVSGTVPKSSSLASFPADAPSPIPLDRWDADRYSEITPKKLEPRFGSFVVGAEAFDGSLFRLSRFGIRISHCLPLVKIVMALFHPFSQPHTELLALT
jgi:hypothetical protein